MAFLPSNYLVTGHTPWMEGASKSATISPRIPDV